MSKVFQKLLIAIICLLFIGIFLYIYSPLANYENSEIYTDSSVFILQGKSLLQGETIYREMWDHKGPVIYIINALGLILGSGSPQGVLIIEALNLLLVCYVLFKAAKLLHLNNVVFILVVLLFFKLVYRYFAGGNLTEEYALLPITLTLYIAVYLLKQKRISLFHSYFIGPIIVSLLLLRMNMMAIVFPLIALLLLYRVEKKLLFGVLFSTILSLLIGFIVISIFSNCKDFYDAYFIFNIKYIDNSGAELVNYIQHNISWILNSNNFLTGFVPIISSLFTVFLIKKPELNKKLAIVLLVIFVVVLASADLSLRGYEHYYMVVVPVAIFIFMNLLSWITYKLREYSQDKRIKKICLALVFGPPVIIIGVISINNILNVYYNNFNPSSSFYSTNELVVAIKKSKQQSLQVIGNSSSLYFKSGKDNHSKYHYTSPIMDISPEMRSEFITLSHINPPGLVAFNKAYNQKDLFDESYNQVDYSIVFEDEAFILYELVNP